jgi:hypothetical protein
MCVRAWPTWKRRVSSTETWYEQECRAHVSRCRTDWPIALKCNATNTENALINDWPATDHRPSPLSQLLLSPTHFWVLVRKHFRRTQNWVLIPAFPLN